MAGFQSLTELHYFEVAETAGTRVNGSKKWPFLAICTVHILFIELSNIDTHVTNGSLFVIKWQPMNLWTYEVRAGCRKIMPVPIRYLNFNISTETISSLDKYKHGFLQKPFFRYRMDWLGSEWGKRAPPNSFRLPSRFKMPVCGKHMQM